MKTIPRTSLSILLMLIIAGCSLPKVTPEVTPSSESQPTSTAPGEPGTPTPIVTIFSAGAPITSANAPQLSASARTAVSNPQQLVWSPDSQSVSLVSQNSSENSSQVFSDAILEVPSLAPKLVYAAPSGIQRLAASSDAKTVAELDQNGEQVDLVDARSKTVLRTLDPGFPAGTITFSPDGKTLSLSNLDQPEVALFDVTLGAQTATLSGFETPATSYTAGFFGSNTAIVWNAAAILQVQDITTQTLSLPFEQEDTTDVFTLASDGSVLAAAAPRTIDGILTPAVSLWSTSTASLSGSLTLTAPAISLAFSPDGTLLAVGTMSQIQVWDVASETVAATLTENPNPVYLLAFSPDGRWLASAYADQLVLWTVPGK